MRFLSNLCTPKMGATKNVQNYKKSLIYQRIQTLKNYNFGLTDSR